MEALSDAQVALFTSGGALADYDILKPIGKGKFSVVYRAKRNADEVLVALKKISIDLMDARARGKTLKEVRLVQSVHHPNIIQYLDAFIAGNELCIAFEWAEAGDLKRQIRKANEKNTRFDERLIWKYFAQVAAAIEHMHLHRIMHRDIKPANIFLMLSGQVKVGDLGLGRHLSENTMEAHSKVGTPLYMSPEVLRGDGYDWKCDVWSLGCILYELAMLRSPFKSEGLNLYGLFQKVNKGEYDPVPAIYSPALQSLVTQMLSLNANDRPTMDAICAVSRACNDSPPKVHPRPTSVDNQKESASRASTPANNPSPEPSPRTNDIAAALTLMDAVYEKLKLLRCSPAALRVPLTPVYFALPGRHHNQWTHALALLQWLFQRLPAAPSVPLDDALQPPLRQATAVLVAAGQLGCAAAAQLAPTSMLCGHGVALCTVLNALCDVALGTLVTARAPGHEKVEAYPDEDSAAEWLADDESPALASSGDDDAYCPSPTRPEGSLGEVPHTVVDPAAWAMEIQRNAPRIHAALLAAYTPVPPWRDHVTALQSFVASAPAEAARPLCTLPNALHADLERVCGREKSLNQRLLPERTAYQQHFDAHLHLSRRVAAKSDRRNSLGAELASLQRAAATAKAAVHEAGDRLTDASQLTGLRSALVTLRADIKAMDLALMLQQAALTKVLTERHSHRRVT
ncbi:NimA-related protein kinase 6 [Achlya hypogyna]|uniref:non-specific serine/threonine protein kinase n=1 Tax=Achlya hypogyna TaxID=1202772 RepID=A0A1V9YVL4_ACHHY|nr:NimA-related protein kinase 6 [Achlya hypogyna]